MLGRSHQQKWKWEVWLMRSFNGIFQKHQMVRYLCCHVYFTEVMCGCWNHPFRVQIRLVAWTWKEPLRCKIPRIHVPNFNWLRSPPLLRKRILRPLKDGLSNKHKAGKKMKKHATSFVDWVICKSKMSNIISLGKQRVILKLTNAVRNAKETNSDVVWFKRKPSILPQLSNVIQCLHTICFVRIEIQTWFCQKLRRLPHNAHG